MRTGSRYAAAVAAQRRPGRESRDVAPDMTELVRLATLAASSHNTQPWTFALADREIAIRPDFSRRCPVVDPDDGHLFKSLGCAAENLVHAAAAQGFMAHVAFEPAAPAVRIALEPAAGLRGGPLFHAIPARQCSRRAYDGRAVSREALAALAAAGAGRGVDTLFIDDATRRDAIAEYVRQGDVAQLSDAAFRRELIAWLRFDDRTAVATGDGLSSRAAGKPAMPAWLARPLLPLVLTARGQAQADVAHIRGSPLLAVVVADRDAPAGWIEVGRACQRLMLQATALGLRSAFINQPIEVRALRPQLHAYLGLTDRHASLMLRLGRGPAAPFSLRRPVADVIAA